MMEALAEGITSACLNGPLLGYPLMNVQAPPPLRPVCQLPSTACLPSLAKDALPHGHSLCRSLPHAPSDSSGCLRRAPMRRCALSTSRARPT